MGYWDAEETFLMWLVIILLIGLVVLVITGLLLIFGTGWVAFIIVGSVAVTAVVRELAARMDGGER